MAKLEFENIGNLTVFELDLLIALQSKAAEKPGSLSSRMAKTIKNAELFFKKLPRYIDDMPGTTISPSENDQGQGDGGKILISNQENDNAKKQKKL